MESCQPDEDQEEYDAWCRCNNIVISWILHAKSGEIAGSIICFRIIGYLLGHKLHGKFPNRNAKGPPLKRASANLTTGEEDKSKDNAPEKDLMSRQYEEQGMKAYKLLDLNTNKVFHSKDVYLDEHIFPYVHAGSVLVDYENFFPTLPSGNHELVSNTSPMPSLPISHNHEPVSLTPHTRTGRKINKPSYLNNYHCYLATHPSIFSSQGSLSSSCIPEWDNAMGNEIDALEKNHTWIVVTLSEDQHVIGCKWVYKIKLNVDGSIERFKARLVAKGYNQQEGVDYTDTFAPVTKLVALKLVLAERMAFKSA
uniref:Reverse transcriptase Ty1/copia-type domain-containing protein n=1 Tax=Cannabis sativa TaxID=3483 RepID=A0A803QQI3_CANSA